MPHRHAHVLADWNFASKEHVQQAIDACREAAREWSAWPWEDRAAVFLKAAELLATRWRSTVNAATMLGQSKTAYQAEIDSAAELIDFWRFNPAYAQELYSEQPISTGSMWNQLDLRPLEGFVYAVTPFNFTSIGGNLPTAPALMGNTVLWKPAATSLLSAHYILQLLEEAGLPPGVINLVTGDSVGHLRGGAQPPRACRHPLHRLHRGVPRHVARGRSEHRPLPHVPARRRRDGGQGLHPRPRQRRRSVARGRHRPRRLRVPGAEVLGGEPRLRARLALAPAPRPRRRADGRAEDGRRGRLPELRRRGHRPQGVHAHLRLPRRRPAGGRQDHRRRARRSHRLLHPAGAGGDERPKEQAHPRGDLRAGGHRVRRTRMPSGARRSTWSTRARPTRSPARCSRTIAAR